MDNRVKFITQIGIKIILVLPNSKFYKEKSSGLCYKLDYNASQSLIPVNVVSEKLTIYY